MNTRPSNWAVEHGAPCGLRAWAMAQRDDIKEYLEEQGCVGAKAREEYVRGSDPTTNPYALGGELNPFAFHRGAKPRDQK